MYVFPLVCFKYHKQVFITNVRDATPKKPQNNPFFFHFFFLVYFFLSSFQNKSHQIFLNKRFPSLVFIKLILGF